MEMSIRAVLVTVTIEKDIWSIAFCAGVKVNCAVLAVIVSAFYALVSNSNKASWAFS